ncbi:NB-ARC domain-containing protein, partial [Streptomyces tendae]
MTDQAVDTDGVRLSQEPAEASGFLGRTRELKELRADIERAGLDTLSGRKAPRARVLLIAGRPGSGRTALAEELAARVADDYPDGVLRARLSEPDGTRVPVERLARDLLGALDRSAPPGADEDDLTEDLRTALADRRVLLLLDAVADAEQVDALLPDTPDCLAVAVAEGPLTGIADVRPCTLGGLDTKSAVELLSRHTGSVRITVDPRAAEQLVELCQAQPAALTDR